jgi:hypothetical protein
MTRNRGRWNEAGKKPEGDHPKEKDVIAARMPSAVMKILWMQPEGIAPGSSIFSRKVRIVIQAQHTM